MSGKHPVDSYELEVTRRGLSSRKLDVQYGSCSLDGNDHARNDLHCMEVHVDEQGTGVRQVRPGQGQG